MSKETQKALIKIGVFYDGNYFYHVSNYYNYYHPRKSRISISGLHQFIRSQVAVEEGTDAKYCQIVDAHYFRGRLNAYDASLKGNLLYYERAFDDILMAEGIATHYLPLKGASGRYEEKGIDVWLAMEALELAYHKRFDVLVLITCDGDYVPLIRKLNALGTRVMVLSWDFEYTNQQGNMVTTRTSQDLLEEVTYPVAMHELLENRVRKNESIVQNIFLPQQNRDFSPPQQPREPAQASQQPREAAPVSQQPRDSNFVPIYQRESGQPETSVGATVGSVVKAEVLSLKAGYGFIKYPPNNLFFHYSSVSGIDFNDLNEGDTVECTLDKNERGEFVAKNVRLIQRNGD